MAAELSTLTFGIAARGVTDPNTQKQTNVGYHARAYFPQPLTAEEAQQHCLALNELLTDKTQGRATGDLSFKVHRSSTSEIILQSNQKFATPELAQALVKLSKQAAEEDPFKTVPPESHIRPSGKPGGPSR